MQTNAHLSTSLAHTPVQDPANASGPRPSTKRKADNQVPGSRTVEILQTSSSSSSSTSSPARPVPSFLQQTSDPEIQITATAKKAKAVAPSDQHLPRVKLEPATLDAMEVMMGIASAPPRPLDEAAGRAQLQALLDLDDLIRQPAAAVDAQLRQRHQQFEQLFPRLAPAQQQEALDRVVDRATLPDEPGEACNLAIRLRAFFYATLLKRMSPGDRLQQLAASCRQRPSSQEADRAQASTFLLRATLLGLVLRQVGAEAIQRTLAVAKDVRTLVQEDDFAAQARSTVLGAIAGLGDPWPKQVWDFRPRQPEPLPDDRHRKLALVRAGAVLSSQTEEQRRETLAPFKTAEWFMSISPQRQTDARDFQTLCLLAEARLMTDAQLTAELQAIGDSDTLPTRVAPSYDTHLRVRTWRFTALYSHAKHQCKAGARLLASCTGIPAGEDAAAKEFELRGIRLTVLASLAPKACWTALTDPAELADLSPSLAQRTFEYRKIVMTSLAEQLSGPDAQAHMTDAQSQLTRLTQLSAATRAWATALWREQVKALATRVARTVGGENTPD